MVKRVPGWVLVLLAVLTVVAAFVALWFVIVMVSFGCDEDWTGCGSAAGAAIFSFLGLTVLTLVGGIIWAKRARTQLQQVLACLLIPSGVVIGVVVGLGYFTWMADRAGV